MHIIQQLKTIHRLEVRPVVEGGTQKLNNPVYNKQEGAYDRFNYNMKNDILNKPENYSKEAIEELEELKKELAVMMGISVEQLIARNKAGLLSGPSRIKVSISNAGMTLKPMENIEDRLKAIILISNNSQVAWGLSDMHSKPKCTYVITEPEETVNVAADEFAIRKRLIEGLAKFDTKEKLLGIIDIYTLRKGLNSRLAADTSQKLIDAKLLEISDDINKAKAVIAVLEDKNLEHQLKIIKFLNANLITYKIGTGYIVPNTEYNPKTFNELVSFLSDNNNSKVFGALVELSIVKPPKK